MYCTELLYIHLTRIHLHAIAFTFISNTMTLVVLRNGSHWQILTPCIIQVPNLFSRPGWVHVALAKYCQNVLSLSDHISCSVFGSSRQGYAILGAELGGLTRRSGGLFVCWRWIVVGGVVELVDKKISRRRTYRYVVRYGFSTDIGVSVDTYDGTMHVQLSLKVS